MPTINQLVKKVKRVKKVRKIKAPALMGCPQKRGVCLKFYTTTPKKPNSALRKVAKIKLTTKRKVLVCVPGEKPSLQQHGVVLVQGRRAPDVPGIRYHLIRGKFDLACVSNRKSARSKYGVKKSINND